MMSEEVAELEVDREDVILLLLEANQKILGKEAIAGVTRLEKLLFLLQKESGFDRMDSLYQFTAHNFGPFSKEVYEALDFLEGFELIEVRERMHPSYYANVGEILLLQEISEGEFDEVNTGNTIAVREKLVCLTQKGREVAQKLRQAIQERRPRDVEELEGIIRRYGKLPLNHLIRYVYRKYPKMTEKSIHPEARRVPGGND